MNNNNNQRSNVSGMAFMAGLALGAGAMLFFPKKWKEQLQSEGEELANTVRDWVEDPERLERIQEIFAENTKFARDTFDEAKETLTDRLSALQVAVGEIDKPRYIKAVGEAIMDLQDSRELSEDTRKKLQRYLEQDFTRLRASVEEEEEKPSRKGRGRTRKAGGKA